MTKQGSFVFIATALLFIGCSKNPSSAELTMASGHGSSGARIVKKNCKVCHAQGANGAPIIGNNKMWNSRANKGIPQLVENVANGFGLMPAKGGNANLSDEEITLAVMYMLEQLD